MATSRRPDYNVGCVIRGTDEKATIGVAWNSDKGDGRISIKLNSFVGLIGSKDLFITLFPVDANDRGETTPRAAQRRATLNNTAMDDDIPF